MIKPAKPSRAPGRRSTGVRRLRILVAGSTMFTASILGVSAAAPASAATLVPIGGAGSTWSSNAMDQWIGDVAQYGIKVNFAATGSSDGRVQYKNATVDFAVSEIPYGTVDNGSPDPAPARKFSYMPIVAGGTSFMYQLHINGQAVTNLRLSGETLAKIYTGVITSWGDPQIAADNPGIVLPARQIVPVVRADGSGTTAQLTTWLAHKYPDLWNAYCGKAGRVLPCGTTSNFPVLPGSGFIAEQQSSGVAGYVTQPQSEGTIGYIEASYAVQASYPVVKVLNAAGYYAEPTASNVAVALTAAQINTDTTSPLYLTQVLTGVYDNPDPRAYPLSSYSYMIVPTALESPMTTDKGYTLGKFAYYFLCQGQQPMAQLGYSPLPRNLVQAAIEEVKKIPGVEVESLDLSKCNNPTFSADGTNLLATTAPPPQSCDKQSATMCATKTGGAKTDTYVAAAPAGPTTTAPPTSVVKKPGKVTKSPRPGAPKTSSPPGVVRGPTPTSTPAVAGNGAAPGGAGRSGAAQSGAPAAGASVSGSPGTKSGTAPATVAAAPVAGGDDPNGAAALPVDANPGAPAQSAASGAAPLGYAAPIRAVPVSLAESTGWTLQDTLMIIAVLVLILITVGPPLLSRRLSARGTSR